METFFTSDLHFGHANIIQYCNRPFASVDEMNAALIERWNDTVSDDDTVYVVGDFAMGKIAETLPLGKQLKGYKILILGNHDRPFDNWDKWIDRYQEVFDEVIPGQITQLFGRPFAICHFPFEGDSHDEDRYVDHRPIDYGYPLIHGHVHDAWKIKDNQFNVGVDVNDFRPVHIDEIRSSF